MRPVVHGVSSPFSSVEDERLCKEQSRHQVWFVLLFSFHAPSEAGTLGSRLGSSRAAGCLCPAAPLVVTPCAAGAEMSKETGCYWAGWDWGDLVSLEPHGRGKILLLRNVRGDLL